MNFIRIIRELLNPFYNLILITFTIFIIGFINLYKKSPKNKPNPTQKTYITQVDSVVTYAGRFDTIPNQKGMGKTSRYLWNGVPRNRQWLTYNEWKGNHCYNREMRKAFKLWKQNEIDSFIEFMCMAAVKESQVYSDIPPELIVAQSILESNFAFLMCSGRTNFALDSRARSPEALIRPPSSLNLKVNLFEVPDLFLASSIIF